MNKKNAGENVKKYFERGHHCAESVAMAVLDQQTNSDSRKICRIASGFCGGMGRTKDEACGALTGGIMALGELFGRNNGNENIDRLCFIVQKYREQFVQNFGTTICKELLEKMETGPILFNCSDLCASSANLLVSTINQVIENMPQDEARV